MMIMVHSYSVLIQPHNILNKLFQCKKYQSGFEH